MRTQGEDGRHKPRREASEGTSPTNTLISDFQPLEPWGQFLLFKPPGLVFCSRKNGSPRQLIQWVTSICNVKLSGIPGKLCMFSEFPQRKQIEKSLWDFKIGKRGSIWEAFTTTIPNISLFSSPLWSVFGHPQGGWTCRASPSSLPKTYLILGHRASPPTTHERHQQHLQATSKCVPNDVLCPCNVWCLTSSSPLTPQPRYLLTEGILAFCENSTPHKSIWN